MKEIFRVFRVIIYIVVLFVIGYTIYSCDNNGEQTSNTVEALTKDSGQDTIEPIEEDEQEVAFYLSDYERYIAECMVMGECGGESYKGQLLVAYCIFNACVKDDIQPSEVREKYLYAGFNEDVTESVRNAVSEIFDDGVQPVDKAILYFYAPKYSKGRWHETQQFVIAEGGHKFFAPWDE